MSVVDRLLNLTIKSDVNRKNSCHIKLYTISELRYKEKSIIDIDFVEYREEKMKKNAFDN